MAFLEARILLTIFIISTLGDTTVIKGINNICGKKQIHEGRQGRIVNGRYTSFGEFPWQVKLMTSSRYNCGGVLLTDQWVLTAAHCVHSRNYYNIEIGLGEHILNSTTQVLPAESRNITRYIMHPSYNDDLFRNGNDIALIMLEEPVKFQPHIQPICLPKSSERHLVGKIGTVTGWGRVSENGLFPSILRKVALPIFENKVCERILATRKIVIKLPESLILCAGYRNGKRSICSGDSGSPIQLQRQDHSWFVAGLVSFHHGDCAYANNPSIFTKVTKFVPWIRRTIYKYSKQIL